MEHLRKHQRSLAVVHEQFSHNEDNNTVVLGVGLAIGADDLVLDLLERQRHQLLHHCLLSVELFAFERQQRLAAVQRSECGTIRIESVVVVLDKLATD